MKLRAPPKSRPADLAHNTEFRLRASVCVALCGQKRAVAVVGERSEYRSKFFFLDRNAANPLSLKQPQPLRLLPHVMETEEKTMAAELFLSNFLPFSPCKFQKAFLSSGNSTGAAPQFSQSVLST